MNFINMTLAAQADLVFATLPEQFKKTENGERFVQYPYAEPGFGQGTWHRLSGFPKMGDLCYVNLYQEALEAEEQYRPKTACRHCQTNVAVKDQDLCVPCQLEWEELQRPQPILTHFRPIVSGELRMRDMLDSPYSSFTSVRALTEAEPVNGEQFSLSFDRKTEDERLHSKTELYEGLVQGVRVRCRGGWIVDILDEQAYEHLHLMDQEARHRELLSRMTQTWTSTGLSVMNFSSNHPFQMNDGTVIPACSREWSDESKMDIREHDGPIGEQKFSTVELEIKLTPILREAVHAVLWAHQQGMVDVCLVPLMVLKALREEWQDRHYGEWESYCMSFHQTPFRTIRKVERNELPIHHDKFCL